MGEAANVEEFVRQLEKPEFCGKAAEVANDQLEEVAAAVGGDWH